MTDAHCHVSCNDPSVRELLIGRDFVGIHPWEAEEKGSGIGDQGSGIGDQGSGIGDRGIGEIGLDRLKSKTISPRMREVFEQQLKLAFELHRPVVLHGAKCWGQVVETVRRLGGGAANRTIEQSNNQTIPPLLFHGFSRSDGLIPDIVALGGFISVGPAILNDHAVNYRKLVTKIPLDRLLVETDRTAENAESCPSIREVLRKTAEIRGLSVAELERITDANAAAFFPPRQ